MIDLIAALALDQDACREAIESADRYQQALSSTLIVSVDVVQATNAFFATTDVTTRQGISADLVQLRDMPKPDLQALGEQYLIDRGRCLNDRDPVWRFKE